MEGNVLHQRGEGRKEGTWKVQQLEVFYCTKEDIQMENFERVQNPSPVGL